MPFRNFTNSTTNSTLSPDIFNELSYAIETYGFKIISTIGALFNMFILIILLSASFKHSIYRYIFCEFFWNFMVCVAGLVVRVPTCPIHCEDTYFQIFIQWFLDFFFNLTNVGSGISDILLLLNRYFILKNAKNKFNKMSKITNISIGFSIPLILCLTRVFAMKIYKNESGLYVWSYVTDSNIIFLYILSIIFTQTVLPLIFIIVISGLVVKEYRNSIRKSKGIKKFSKKNYHLNEIRFTRMVFAMTVISLISRSTLLVIDGFVAYGDMFGSVVKESVCIFMFKLSYLIILMEQTTHGFFFINQDANFKSAILKIYHKIKLIVLKNHT